MKATFFERLGSYLLDTIIVSLILSLICLGFSSSGNSQKLMEELDNKLLANEIAPDEYLKEYEGLLYDYQKENVLQLGISTALTVAYFVIFQYMNNGQTLGKKILKIKVVDKDNKKPISILKGLLRSFLILSILSGTLNIVFLYVLNKNIYFTAYATVLGIETIFSLITVMFVLYKKDGRGLHDIIANTTVIKESK